MPIRCDLLSNTSPVSLLANEFDIRSALHGHVILAAVNHIYVFHGVVNSGKNLKILLVLVTVSINSFTKFQPISNDTIIWTVKPEARKPGLGIFDIVRFKQAWSAINTSLKV